MMDVDAIPNTHCMFVNVKISSVSWQPGVDQAGVFVTGSWDEGLHNNITVWRINPEYVSALSCEDAALPDAVVSVASCAMPGDVNQVTFIDEANLLVASECGLQHVTLGLEGDDRVQLDVAKQWHQLHPSKHCTGFSVHRSELVTFGTDGRIRLVELDAPGSGTVIGGDSATVDGVAAIQCGTHVAHSQVVTGTVSGHVHLWDVRAKGVHSVCQTVQAASGAAVTALCCRPSQPHMIAVATQDGQLGFIDVRRMDQFSPELIDFNTSCINQVLLHPDYEENGFSVNENGEMWQWDLSSFRDCNIGHNRLVNTTKSVVPSESFATWLTSGDVIKERVKFTRKYIDDQGLPLNAMDVHGSQVVLGGDSGVVVIINDINLK